MKKIFDQKSIILSQQHWESISEIPEKENNINSKKTKISNTKENCNDGSTPKKRFEKVDFNYVKHEKKWKRYSDTSLLSNFKDKNFIEKTNTPKEIFLENQKTILKKNSILKLVFCLILGIIFFLLNK